MLNDRFDHRVLYELFVIFMYTASLYLSPAIIKSVKQMCMTIKKPILTFLFLNTEFLLSDISLFRSLLLHSRNRTSRLGAFRTPPALLDSVPSQRNV